MKAIILAGGKGIRGRPFTEIIPKAMIPYNGKPIIHYIVKHITNFKLVDEILIVTDIKGIGGQIKNYFNGRKHKKKITFVQDSQSGTASDLLHITKYVKTSFLLWFSDNLCAIDLKKMFDKFKKTKVTVCIATRNRRREKTGFVISKDSFVIEFKEKPIIKLPMEECLGIYFMSTKIIAEIRKSNKKNINLSFDILQKLVKNNNVSIFDINKPWIDIESPTVINNNNNVIKKITKLMEH